MKKLILAACLCIGAFVIAPVASASATEFVGSCKFNGTASFTNPMSTKLAEANEYKFESGAGTSCSGIVKEGATEETAVEAEAKASVHGKGLLSCSSSTSGTTPGEGELTVKGKTVKFSGFTFVAA